MSKNISKKLEILIVGSFPPLNIKNIYGGQLTACRTLIESEFSEAAISFAASLSRISSSSMSCFRDNVELNEFQSRVLV